MKQRLLFRLPDINGELVAEEDDNENIKAVNHQTLTR